MPARKPEDCDTLGGEAISRGDIDAAAALYEPSVSFVPEPGQIVTGTEAIREAMTGLLAMNPDLTVDVTKVVQAGELALLCSDWTLKGTGEDGEPVVLTGQGTEVVRRQSDGTWRFIIDNPYGTA